MTDLGRRVAAACASVGAGQSVDQCHVERRDLNAAGRRAKMLEVWAMFVSKNKNVLKTAEAFGCTRNTVKRYVRLYQQEQHQ